MDLNIIRTDDKLIQTINLCFDIKKSVYIYSSNVLFIELIYSRLIKSGISVNNNSILKEKKISYYIQYLNKSSSLKCDLDDIKLNHDYICYEFEFLSDYLNIIYKESYKSIDLYREKFFSYLMSFCVESNDLDGINFLSLEKLKSKDCFFDNIILYDDIECNNAKKAFFIFESKKNIPHWFYKYSFKLINKHYLINKKNNLSYSIYLPSDLIPKKLTPKMIFYLINKPTDFYYRYILNIKKNKKTFNSIVIDIINKYNDFKNNDEFLKFAISNLNDVFFIDFFKKNRAICLINGFISFYNNVYLKNNYDINRKYNIIIHNKSIEVYLDFISKTEDGSVVFFDLIFNSKLPSYTEINGSIFSFFALKCFALSKFYEFSKIKPFLVLIKDGEFLLKSVNDVDSICINFENNIECFFESIVDGFFINLKHDYNFV